MKSFTARNEIPRNLVAFNFDAPPLSISSEDVPTLVPPKVMAELTNGDSEPYFKIQAIEYPVEGSGIFPHDKATYTEEFFQSFIDVTNKRPIPGSKRGHEWGSRPNNDAYMVGGKLDKKGNGTGTVFFKNYVPPEGDGTSNLGFIRDLKAGIVHFSLVTMPEYNVGDDEIMYITGSLGHERNDAVSYGDGAMAQTTNSLDVYNPYPNYHSARLRDPDDFEKDSFRYVSIDKEAGIDSIMGRLKGKDKLTIQAYRFKADKFTEAEAKKWLKDHDVKYISFEKASGKDQSDNIDFDVLKVLVENGQFDSKTNAHGDVIQNGLVMRSVLRRNVSHADASNKKQYSELLSMIDSKSNKKGANMDKEELFTLLKNMKQNGEITLSEVANAMGLADQVITDDHKSAIATVNSLKEIEVTDPAKEIKDLRNKLEAVDADRVVNALDAAFGPEKDNDGKINPLRSYASKMVDGVKAENIDEKIEELKKDEVMKQLAGNKADFRSEMNTIGIVENQGDGESVSLSFVH